MDGQIIVKEYFEIPKGYEKVTKIEKMKEDYKPSFRLAGDGKKNRQGYSMNLVEETCNFTSQEQWLFIKIEKELDDKNVSIVRSKPLTKVEKEKLSIGYKRLRSKDLVRRIRREHYMVNPRLIIPKDFRERELEYKQLK